MPADENDSDALPPTDAELREELDRPHSTEGAQGATMFGGDRRKPAAPIPGVQARQTIGDFELIELLGQGGMGQVWLALQRSLERRVALKLVRPERVSAETMALFAREARAGGRLNHPGIVSVHGYGDDEGLAWIAMELVEGAWTLRDYLDEAAKGEQPGDDYRQVAEFIVLTADALQAAHEANVIHRDLKPQNILITAEDEPKVTDFGLAKIIDEVALSVTGDFAGTYAYMSPEQAMAKRMGIDHRTDLFSLGVVLYEMLTLRRPFDGDTAAQVAHQIVTKEAPDPRTLRSRVPRDLVVICGKCLEKDRDRRYATMSELAADLRRYLNDEPILARPPSRWRKAELWAKRNPIKALIAVAGPVGFSVVTTLLVTNWRINRDLARSAKALEEGKAVAEENARRALIGQSRYLAKLAEDHTTRGDATTAALIALEALPTPAEGGDRPHVVEAEASLRRAVGRIRERWVFRSDAGGEAYRVAFSPDGGTLAAGFFDGSAYLLNVEGESVAELAGHEGQVLDVTFDSSGARVVTAATDGTARVWDMTGAQRAVLTHDRKTISNCAFSPDGTTIVTFALGDPEGILTLWRDGAVAHEVAAMAAAGFSQTSARMVSDESVVFRDPRGVATIALEDGEIRRVFDRQVGRLDSPFAEYDPSGTRIVAFVVGRAGVDVWTPGEGSLLLDTPAIRLATFDPLGERLVTVDLSAQPFPHSRDWQGAARIWDARTGEARAALGGHEDFIYQAAFSPDGRIVATCSEDGTARLWTVEGELTAILGGHGDGVRYVAFSPDGLHVATCSKDGSLRLWDTQLRSLLEFEAHDRPVDRVAYSPGGDVVLTASRDKTVRLWGADGEERAVLSLSRPVRSAALHPSGREVVVTDRWDAQVFDAEGALLVELEHPDRVEHVDYSHAGDKIVTCGRDGAVRLWSRGGAPGGILLGHEGRVNHAAFSPGDERIATASGDGTARLWDANGRCLAVLEGHAGNVMQVAWRSDGGEVMTLGFDGEARRWSLDGTCTAILRPPSGDLTCAEFGPDRSVVAGASDGTVWIWSGDGSKPLGLEGHTDGVVACAVHPRGDMFATVSSDRSTRLWTVAGSALEVHVEDAPGTCVTFSPDGSRMLVGRLDGTVLARPTPGLAELIEQARRVVPRRLSREQRRELFLEED